MKLKVLNVWLCAILLISPIVHAEEPDNAASPPLRVGMSTSFKPIAFIGEDGALQGVEVNFAHALSGHLGRPLQLVPMEWPRLFNAVLNGQIDIVMAGTTITPQRADRVAFTGFYLENPLVAITKVRRLNRYPTRDVLLHTTDRIGTIRMNVSDQFARSELPQAHVVTFTDRSQVPGAMETGHIDMYLDDLSSALLFADADEDWATLPFLLKEQQLGWAVHPTNTALLAEANAALAAWKEDGTVETIISRWIPHRRDWMDALQTPPATDGP